MACRLIVQINGKVRARIEVEADIGAVYEGYTTFAVPVP
jgi:hypothetical protein